MAKVVHTIKGHEYLYEHYRVGEKVVCDYIGKVGDDIKQNTKEVTQQTKKAEHLIINTLPKIKIKKVSLDGTIVRFSNVDDIIQRRVVNSINRMNKKLRGMVDKINVYSAKGNEFIVNGKKFYSGGNWNKKLKSINVYSVNEQFKESINDVDRVISHEIGHSLYDKITDSIQKFTKQLAFPKNLIDEEVKELKELRDSLENRLFEFQRASDKEGGLTSYSHSYFESKSITRYTENFAEAVRLWASGNIEMKEVENKIEEFGETYKAFNKLMIDYFEGISTDLSLNPKNIK